MKDLTLKKISFYFQKVYRLALKAKFICRSNPAVGAVIVYQDEIVGKGYTQEYGGAHAEVVAIQQAKKKLFETETKKGVKKIIKKEIEKIIKKKMEKSILFVSLTPCDIYGKTPPCCDAILTSGIGKVCIANKDPFLQQNSSEKKLTDSKVKVVYNCPKEINQKLLDINKDFFYRTIFNLPWIHMKYAMTLDGKIATKNLDSKWITDESARKNVQQERAIYDAVMVGQGTFFYDNPSLIPRVKKKIKQPLIFCALTKDFSKNQIQKIKKHQLLNHSTKTFFFVKEEFKNFIGLINSDNLLFYKKCWTEKSFLHKVVKQLNINSIYLEGGAFTHGLAVKNKIVNSFGVYIAPKFLIDGLNGLSPLSHKDKFVEKMSSAISSKNVKITKIGDQVLIKGILNDGEYQKICKKVF